MYFCGFSQRSSLNFFLLAVLCIFSPHTQMKSQEQTVKFAISLHKQFWTFTQLLGIKLANRRIPDSLTAKFETQMWAQFTKICTRENYQPHRVTLLGLQFKSWTHCQLPCRQFRFVQMKSISWNLFWLVSCHSQQRKRWNKKPCTLFRQAVQLRQGSQDVEREVWFATELSTS